jgi:UDP-N-acetylglucosamine 1-carboxyvinyltransferase
MGGVEVDVFRIMGGKRLSGRVRLSGAKNAVLPILAAALLTDEPVVLKDCPRLKDVSNMLSILQTLGCTYQRREDEILVDASGAQGWEMPGELSKQLRSSIFMMGSILGRFRRATVTYPGGCEIGLRPIDLHLSGLRALGVRISEAHGMIYCDGSDMRGGEVQLDFPSVGATENVMMAAVLSKGQTVIHNAAREPEIEDLQNFINAMGGKVRGAGSSTIFIEGVSALHGAVYSPLPDRIVAGTLMAAAAATGGELELDNVHMGDLAAVSDKMRQAGCEIETRDNALTLRAPRILRPVRISTQPFPGFPTDMQAQMMAMACLAQGTSVIVENVFENRFAQASQLRRMGADILIHDRTAVIHGGRLTGASVASRDLRGGAALVIAALAAEGVSEVSNVEFIDRGYDALECTLSALGAQIQRLS